MQSEQPGCIGATFAHVSRRPRFRFIPTLGVSVSSAAARAVLGEGLGLPLLDEDDAHQAYGRGRLSLYVDTTGAAADVPGFLPMLGTDDYDDALAHLAAHGCTFRPMPWAEDAPGVLVEGPEQLRFCVVPLGEVIERRAQRFLDESMEGPPVMETPGIAKAGSQPPASGRPAAPRLADDDEGDKSP